MISNKIFYFGRKTIERFWLHYNITGFKYFFDRDKSSVPILPLTILEK